MISEIDRLSSILEDSSADSVLIFCLNSDFKFSTSWFDTFESDFWCEACYTYPEAEARESYASSRDS